MDVDSFKTFEVDKLNVISLDYNLQAGAFSRWPLNLLHTNFICGFYNILFISMYTFFFENRLLIVHIIRVQYNKLQFGLRISSIEASKQKLGIATLLYVYIKTYSKKKTPMSEYFLKSEVIQSVFQ